MEADKILMMHLTLEMDDLKDSKMLIEYAEEAKKEGEEQLAQKLIAKAKTRMQSFDNCEAEITNYLTRIKAEDPEADTDEMMHTVYKQYFIDEKDSIKNKLLSM